MATSIELNDVVGFEIPTFTAANRLACRLVNTWHARIDDLGHAWLVTVELRFEEGDLAVLLRDIESWIDSSGLGGLRFSLDGRDYVIEGSDPVGEPALLT